MRAAKLVCVTVAMVLVCGAISVACAAATADASSSTRIHGSLLDGVGESDLRKGGATLSFHILGSTAGDPSTVKDAQFATDVTQQTMSAELVRVVTSSAPDSAWAKYAAKLFGTGSDITITSRGRSLRVRLAPVPDFSAMDKVEQVVVNFPTRLLTKDSPSLPVTSASFLIIPGARAVMSLVATDTPKVGEQFAISFEGLQLGPGSSTPTMMLVSGQACSGPAVVPLEHRLQYEALTREARVTVYVGAETVSLCYIPSVEAGMTKPQYVRATGTFSVVGPTDYQIGWINGPPPVGRVTPRVKEDFNLRFGGYKLTNDDDVVILDKKTPTDQGSGIPSCAALQAVLDLDASQATADRSAKRPVEVIDVLQDSSSQAHTEPLSFARPGPRIVCYRPKESPVWVQVGKELSITTQLDYVSTVTVSSDDVILTQNYHANKLLVSGPAMLNLDSHSINTSALVWEAGAILGHGTLNLRKGGKDETDSSKTPHRITGGRKEISFLINNFGHLTIDADCLYFYNGGSLHNYGQLTVMVPTFSIDRNTGLPTGYPFFDGSGLRNTLFNAHGATMRIVSKNVAAGVAGALPSSYDEESGSARASQVRSSLFEFRVDFENHGTFNIGTDVAVNSVRSVRAQPLSRFNLDVRSAFNARDGEFGGAVTLAEQSKFVVAGAFDAQFAGTSFFGPEPRPAAATDDRDAKALAASQEDLRPLVVVEHANIVLQHPRFVGELGIMFNSSAVRVVQNVTFGPSTIVALSAARLEAGALSFVNCEGLLLMDVTNVTIGHHVALQSRLQAILFGTGAQAQNTRLIPQSMPHNASFVLPPNATLLLLDLSTPALRNGALASQVPGPVAPRVCNNYIVIPVYVQLQGEAKMQGCAFLPYGGTVSGVIRSLDDASAVERSAVYAFCRSTLSNADGAVRSSFEAVCQPLMHFTGAAKTPLSQVSGVAFGGKHLLGRDGADKTGDYHVIENIDYVEVVNGATFEGVDAVHIAARNFLVSNHALITVAKGGRFKGDLLTIDGIIRVGDENTPFVVDGSMRVDGTIRFETPSIGKCNAPSLDILGDLWMSSESRAQCVYPASNKSDQWSNSWQMLTAGKIQGSPREIVGCSDLFEAVPTARDNALGAQFADVREVPSSSKKLLGTIVVVLVAIVALCVLIARIGGGNYFVEIIRRAEFHLSMPEFRPFIFNWFALVSIVLDAGILSITAFHPHVQPIGFDFGQRLASYITAIRPGGAVIRAIIVLECVVIVLWFLSWLPLLGERISNRLKTLLRGGQSYLSMHLIQLFFQWHTYASFIAPIVFIPVVSSLLNPIACATVLTDVKECSVLRPLGPYVIVPLVIFLFLAPYSLSSNVTPFGHPPYIRDLDVRYKRSSLVAIYIAYFITIALAKIYGRDLMSLAISQLVGIFLLVLVNTFTHPCAYHNINRLRLAVLLFPALMQVNVLIQVSRFGQIPAFLCRSVDPVFVAILVVSLLLTVGLAVFDLRRCGRIAKDIMAFTGADVVMALAALLEHYSFIKEQRLNMYNAATDDERDRIGRNMGGLHVEFDRLLQAFREKKEPRLLVFYLGKELAERVISEEDAVTLSFPGAAGGGTDNRPAEGEGLVVRRSAARTGGLDPSSPGNDNDSVAMEPVSKPSFRDIDEKQIVHDVESLTPEQLNDFKEGPIIGRGTYGSVFMGMLSMGKLVAVKAVPIHKKHHRDTSTLLNNIKREINVLKGLKHDNIVRYFGCNVARNYIYLFMELATSGSLTQLVRKFNDGLPENVLKMYTRQILSGLLYLHGRGVIHRDIKGENILIDSFGVCKLADFGCSKTLADVALRSAGGCESLVGSPYWMAPEVIRNEKYGTKADVWSLGCTVVEMLNGGHPPWHEKFDNVYSAMFFIGNSTGIPSNIPEQVSADCRAFLGRCFERDVTRRANVQELLAHSWLSSEPSTPSTPSTEAGGSARQPGMPARAASEILDERIAAAAAAATAAVGTDSIRSDPGSASTAAATLSRQPTDSIGLIS